MLHEVYAPRAAGDVAWSRQKAVALSTLLQQMRSGARGSCEAPRIVLLYGPPGCGKLETLKLFLCGESSSVADPAPMTLPRGDAGATASLAQNQRTTLNIFHTCDATPQAYAQHLQSISSYCRGHGAGVELPLSSLSDPSVMCISSGGGSSGIKISSVRDSGMTLSSEPAPVKRSTNHAHIIKFYGEAASHSLHRHTISFLREYEEMRVIAQREELVRQKQQVLCAGTRAGDGAGLMSYMRRNLVFFLHTIHDSHNDKRDLNTSFPSTLLQSPAVSLFHCTPITEINLRKRLRAILDAEARRRWGGASSSKETFVDFDTPSSTRVSSSAPGKLVGHSSRAKRGVRPSAHTRASTSASPSGADLLDPATLNDIAAGSHGDIRQALLQVQWWCLKPEAQSLANITLNKPESTNGSSLQVSETAASIWERLMKRKMSAPHKIAILDKRTDNGPQFSPSVAEKTLMGSSGQNFLPCASANGLISKTRPEVPHGSKDGCGHTQKKCTSKVVEEVSSDDSIETIEILSDSSEASNASTPRASHNGGGRTQVHRGAVTSRKRARSPSPMPAASLFSLLDFHMETPQDLLDLGSASTRDLRGERRRGAHRIATPPTTAAESQERIAPAMTRDEYLGLSHAIGRLLTQKYGIDEVLNLLNVPARKILDYLANNQILYFGEDQLPQYAHCIDAASYADSLQACDVNGGFAGGPSASALRERRQLAERTTAWESIDNTGRLLDACALYLYHGIYCAVQTEVRPPPGFVPQKPPPYLHTAYPRLRDTSYERIPYSTFRKKDCGPTDLVTLLDEREWLQKAVARLQSATAVCAGVSSETVDSWGNGSRRLELGTAGGSTPPASFTPPIQNNEIDVLREGLPDLLYRCGRTEAVVLDYYALAPYIMLTLDPQPPQQPSSSGGVSAPHGSALLSQAPGAMKTPSQSTGEQQSSGTLFLSSPLHGGTPASTTVPRRTIFRFAHTAPDIPRLRTCTPLQLEILQRGRDPATAQLRKNIFGLPRDGYGDGATADAAGSSLDNPLIPEGDEIEDIDED